jgi:adenosylmethionine-8-amino-7-oxononanoate aminotransferase
LPALIAAFERAIGDDPADLPMAVLVEPLINVGAGIVLPAGFLRELRRLCDERSTLLIVDEVFTGCGRTGRMFGFQHDDIEPDILIASKGLSGGYAPIATTTAQQRIYQTFDRDPFIGGLRYGHTTSGHAVACAAAIATLEVIERDGLVERSRTHGAKLLAQLEPLVGRGEVVDVRGLGLVLVIELATEEAASRMLARAQANGLLLRQQGAAVMAVPPLTVDDSVIDAIAEHITTVVEHRGTS